MKLESYILSNIVLSPILSMLFNPLFLLPSIIFESSGIQALVGLLDKALKVEKFDTVVSVKRLILTIT